MSFEKEVTGIKKLVEAFPMPMSPEDKADGLMGKSASPLPDDGPVFKAADHKEVNNRRRAITVTGAGIVSAIMDAMSDDSEDHSEPLYTYYMQSTPEVKKVIDHVTMLICGWAVPTLAEQGHRKFGGA